MKLWKEWWRWASPLRTACGRSRTFLWMVVVLMGFSVREDLLGVTSIVRSLGLKEACYDRLLDFFHSPALNLEALTRIWAALVLDLHPGLLRCNGRVVLVGDGIKVGKSGKKMPAVKRLHQESGTNGKPPYIMGHSCQAVSVLARGLQSVAAIPLAARIHEGLVFSNRDKRTLLDKMIQLLVSLDLNTPFYFVADAYYASRKVAAPLLRKGNHLVTRVRNNAVAYLAPPPPEPRKRGRRRTYGQKVALKSLFDQAMQTMDSPVYGERSVQIRFRALDLLWRPMGVMVRFVAVEHPTRGRCILMTTDLQLDPADILRLYGYRFKIELTFKRSLHVLGAFLYHFWMATMTHIGRKTGNQHLHRKSDGYRHAVRRKMDAYHRFMQLGLISQGIMLALATTVPQLVWRSFGSWLRTIRPGVCPSEFVVASALRSNLPDFLADEAIAPELVKFLRERLDMARTQAIRLAA
ncbi:MAG: transposase [Lentisphaerota bacterium]